MIDGFGPAHPPEPVEVPAVLPVLPLRDLVIYPFIIVPLSVSRDRSIQAVEQALAEHRMLLLVAQKNEEVENPQWDDLYRVGTVATVMRMLKLPDSRIRILVQGLGRARVEYPTEETAFHQARVESWPERPGGESLEAAALVRAVKAGLERIAALGKNLSSEVLVIAANLTDAGRLADLAASNLELGVADAQQVLEAEDPIARLRDVLRLINHEAEMLEMQQRITSQARSEIDRGQREYYLRQQLKAIERELGEGSELSAEAQQLRARVEALAMPKPIREETLKQIDRLARMHADSAETTTLRNYLEWTTTLPWGKMSRDRIDLKRAARVLEADHFGLDRVKQRVLEFLAVRKLRSTARGPILCFVGPPGVGKTSLGQSVARALGRKFVRQSLGGVRDEAEIRGHRRTYVGALPGRIVQGIHQAGTANPVFMIDEVDKIGSDFRGDPSSALLEVLDPEQNHAFRDHYLNLPFDLSHVLFIATANLLDPIQPAFRDRMEVISIEGYTEEEKLAIAERHLLPRQIAENGLLPSQIKIADEAIRAVIRGWTREAGLRNLERELGALCRKVAREVAEGRRRVTRIGASDLGTYLGPPRVLPDELLDRDRVGVAAGLAWTAAGGEVLMVEALVMRGNGELILTGQLGAVMKESAQAAASYLRSRAGDLGIDPEVFGRSDIHVHIPEGAIPKDGPSAGVAMAAAIASALTSRPVRHRLAMSGEITLRGHVLPVGGIKEKLLAARRAKVESVLLPRLNRKEVEDLAAGLLGDLGVVYVEEVREALDRVLA